MSKTQKYFPGLNALRFIGAFAVLLGHLEFVKSLYGLENLQKLSFYKNTSGHLGVILFFVISGFLITYLLLKEKEKTGVISIKKFYIRRLLRIWPLYYLMVVLSIFVVPYFPVREFSLRESAYYFLFLPNVGKSLGITIDGVVHLWSVGVEEQFYLIWPWVLVIFRKYLLGILLLIFIGVSVSPFVLGYLNYNEICFLDNDVFHFLNSFILHFKINSMAIGGSIAYIYFHNKKWLHYFQGNVSEVLIFCGTFLLWGFGITFGAFTDEIYSVLFGLLIFNIATKERPLIRCENSFFNFMGKISYGIYVYHWLIILSLVHMINYVPFFKEMNGVGQNLVLYVGTVLLTVTISHLSYTYFERPFLKLKDRFNS
jgi:peptidoglycan/LPS O-acetylase OafA/YrhL